MKLPPVTDRNEDGSPEKPCLTSREIQHLVPRLIGHIALRELRTSEVFDWSLTDLEQALADIGKEEYPATPELQHALCCRLLRESMGRVVAEREAEERRAEDARLDAEMCESGADRCPGRE